MHSNGHHRPAASLIDVLVVLAWLTLVAFVLLTVFPLGGRARGLSIEGRCRSNLRGIGQAMHIYANDHGEYMPAHSFRARQNDSGTIRDHGVSWVGAMGSNVDLKISEATSPTKGPTRSHPSRSLFLLVIGGQGTVKQFICPSSGDVDDDLRNYGPDAQGKGDTVPAQPGVNRFDFRGYNSLSYGINLPYSRPLNTAADPRMAIAADKSPYYQSGGSGLAETKTTIDARSALSPPKEWSNQDATQLAGNAKWRKYNSRNHKGEGQNILFADGHAEFHTTPLAGVNQENIYTIADGQTPQQFMIGIVPDANQTIGPAIETDSFIVP